MTERIVGYRWRGAGGQEIVIDPAEVDVITESALDRMAEQIAAIVAELPPIEPGTALGVPIHQRVRDLRLENEQLRAALAETDRMLFRWSKPWPPEPDTGRRPLSVRERRRLNAE